MEEAVVQKSKDRMERNPTQIRDQRQESVYSVRVERQWESDGHNPHLCIGVSNGWV